jgi:hypothetical protein
MEFFVSIEVADIIMVLIGVCLQIYFFICILSLYSRTKNGENVNGQIHMGVSPS